MAHNKAFGNCIGPFGFPMQEEDARELDVFLEKHSSDSAVGYKHIIKNTALECFIDKEHADVSVVSDGSIDLQKHIVKPDGLDWKNYQKNPVVSVGHRYDGMPVAKSIWQKQIRDKWKAKTQYINRPPEFPAEKEWVPDTVWHMVKNGVLQGKSIGAMPLTWHEPTADEIARDYTLKGCDVIFDTARVYEYAICTLPVNENCITELVSKGIVSFQDAFLKSVFPKFGIDPDDDDADEEEDTEIYRNVSGITKSQYEHILRSKCEQHLQVMTANLPQLVDDIFARLMGHV